MDIAKLEQNYIIVKTRGVSDLAARANLRLLDNELEAGIKVLYDDDEESIVAFLFARGRFDDESAAAWIEEAKSAGIPWSLTVPVHIPVGASFSLACLMPSAKALPAAIDDVSFDDITQQLAEALEGVDYEGVMIDGKYRWPWLIEVYTEFVIVEVGGKYYQAPYWMDEDTNRIQFGDFVEVRRTYVPADLTGNGTPQVFTLALRDVPADSLRAEVATDDTLLWKEVFRASTTFRPDAGTVLIVPATMVQALYDSFVGGAMDQIPITATGHFWETGGFVPAADTGGFIDKMVYEEGHLYAGLRFVDQGMRDLVDSGKVVDVSIYCISQWADGRTGKVWDWVMLHLLLTNYPQITDMRPFGEKPANVPASTGAVVKHYTEVAMSGKNEQPAVQVAAQAPAQPPAAPQMSEEDRTLLEEARALRAEGLSLSAVREQTLALRKQARGLEVRSIVAALEGRQDREDVIQVEGYRHYPAVIVAAEGLLGESVALEAVSQEGHAPVDQVVLKILNALPKEARMAVGAQPPKTNRTLETEPGTTPATDPHRTEPLSPEQYKTVPEEAIDGLTARVKR